MGASLFGLCVPSGFGGRTESEVTLGHMFPQGVLAVMTLVRGGLEMKELSQSQV